MVFEELGYREITPDETLALAAQFQGNPDAMQIMQLFRNWSQQKRRHEKASESSSSQAQSTGVRTILSSILKIMFPLCAFDESAIPLHILGRI